MKKFLSFLLCLTLVATVSLVFFAKPTHAWAVGDACPHDSVVAVGPCPGHLIKEYITSYTVSNCIQQAEYILVCDTCGDPPDYASNPVYYEPLGNHEYAEQTAARVEPTCTTNGNRHLICQVCKNAKDEPIAALGHNNTLTGTVEATCTENGRRDYRCTRCGNTSNETIPALGHDFPDDEPQLVVGTDSPATYIEPTCTEEGSSTVACTRCGLTNSTPIPALGHDYQPSAQEATCTEEGFDLQICTRCGDEQGERFPALGHDMTLTATKEATCTQDGSKTYSCARCGETTVETLPATGHTFPEDWVIEKKATPFAEGLQSHECELCGETETEVIPKTSLLPVIIGGGAAAGGIAGILIAIAKKRAAKKAAKDAAWKAARQFGKPSIQVRNVLMVSEDEDFVAFMKSKKLINTKTCDAEELETGITDNEPNVIIMDINQSYTLEDWKAIAFEEVDREEQKFSFIVSDKVLPGIEPELEKLVEDGKIVGYAPKSANDNVKLVKLYLPVAKPELTTDEGLENIAMVADAFGIPLVSNIIGAYETTRDIKNTLKDSEGDLDVDSASIIVSDIATLLGLDTVASVVGLVDDMAVIKDTLTSEANAVTVTDGYDAGADIVDVVTDLLDK